MLRASNARFEARYTRHMPLVLRARLSSPCRPEKAAEAELSRMSRMCRGCQKRIRDRLTLYKITIYL